MPYPFYVIIREDALLVVQNAKEALYIACEMEKRAIKLYQRGAMVSPALEKEFGQMEADERVHLERFTHMGEELEGVVIDEKKLLLNAYASQALFPGGLMEAGRVGGLDEWAAYLKYAQSQEEQAAACYREFASQCEDEGAKQMFLSIALEEDGHLQDLKSYKK